MIGLFFTGDRKLTLKQLPKPTAKKDVVVVKVKAAAICGTDRENFEKQGQVTVPGHEVAGVVEEAGSSSVIRKGDRVALNLHIRCGTCEYCLIGAPYMCRKVKRIGSDYDGGFAEYIAVPDSCCIPLDKGLSFEQGCLLVDMLGTPYAAYKKLQPFISQRVVIWGAGPIGLGALMVAKWHNHDVAVIDTNEFRLDMAAKTGADLLIHPGKHNVAEKLDAWSLGKGVRGVLECSGNSIALRQAIDLVGLCGMVVIVGVSRSLQIDPWEDIISREISISGSISFNDADFDEMAAFVRQGLAVTDAVTHRFPLSEAKKAFNVFSSGMCGKIIFTN
jgi:threonine dehydrogenase-like Zn-dependent dehydrogenase